LASSLQERLQYPVITLRRLRTSNLHLANDGPCRLQVGDGNVRLFRWNEELVQDLQGGLAIDVLVDQRAKAASRSGGRCFRWSESAHGRRR
jgi:hypothetical protein